MQTPLDFAKSITDDEIDFISRNDGTDEDDVAIHKCALRSLIFEQDCNVNLSIQYWHPYECVELGRWSCQKGHEREFAICNIIIGISIISGADYSNDPNYMLEKIAGEYDKLPNQIRQLVLDTLLRAVAGYDG